MLDDSRRQDVERRTILVHTTVLSSCPYDVTFFITPFLSRPPTACRRIHTENVYPEIGVTGMPHTAPTACSVQASQLSGYIRSPLHNMALSDDTHPIEPSGSSYGLLSHPTRSTSNSTLSSRQLRRGACAISTRDAVFDVLSSSEPINLLPHYPDSSILAARSRNATSLYSRDTASAATVALAHAASFDQACPQQDAKAAQLGQMDREVQPREPSTAVWRLDEAICAGR
jgi:hypothetical protein